MEHLHTTSSVAHSCIRRMGEGTFALARIAAPKRYSSSSRRSFTSGVASGTSSPARSIPTDWRIAWLSYSASYGASSPSVYHCCVRYMRNILGTPIGWPPNVRARVDRNQAADGRYNLGPCQTGDMRALDAERAAGRTQSRRQVGQLAKRRLDAGENLHELHCAAAIRLDFVAATPTASIAGGQS